NHFGFIGAKEDDVAILCASAVDNRLQCCSVNIFNDWALQAFLVQLSDVVDFDICQTFCAVDFDEFGISVNFATRNCSAIWYAQGSNTSASHIGSACEY